MVTSFTCFHPIKAISQNFDKCRAWMSCLTCGEELKPEGLRILYIQKTDEHGKRVARVQAFWAPGEELNLNYIDGSSL